MHLPRRLSASTLGDLLGTLYRGETTGVLELRESPPVLGAASTSRVHRIHLFCGAVSGVDTPLLFRPLGQVLKQKGLLRAEALAELLHKLQIGDPRMSGVILFEDGLAPHESIRSGLHTQLKEKLDRVYTLQEAEVRFYTARPLPESARRLGLLGALHFLHGRPRARDRNRARDGFAAKPPPQNTAHAWEDFPYDFFAEPERHDETPPPTSGVQAISEVRRRALQTLGLRGNADVPAIRKAFRRMAATLHPDVFVNADERSRAQANARFAEVSAAYHLLVA